jgi:hypothetical protein
MFSILKTEIQQADRMLVIDGELDPVFNETLMPYLEY